MKQQTGDTYIGSMYAKATMMSTAKMGKSCTIIANVLGVMPWQKEGGVVDSPKNLHVIAIDANSLGGIKRFLLESCKAPPEALQFTVWNLSDDVRQTYAEDEDYSLTFFNALQSTLERIKQNLRGVPVIHMASLSGASMAIERGVIGPPGSAGRKNSKGELSGKGFGDLAKWQVLSHQLSTVQNSWQVDTHHMIFEAHVDRGPQAVGNSQSETKESIKVPGSAGRHWGLNSEQLLGIRREYGAKHPNTNVDRVYFDTRSGVDAVLPGGRNFTEALDAKEYDLTVAFKKLGLKVGHWGSQAKKKVP